MKKIYNVMNLISRKAPMSAMWSFINGTFSAELAGKDTIKYYSGSWYRKYYVNPRKSGYFTNLSMEEIGDMVEKMVFDNPSWLDPSNYYDAFLKGMGITRSNFYTSSIFSYILASPLLILKSFEDALNDVAFSGYRRDPVNGRDDNPNTDTDYNSGFNYGYQWEFIVTALKDLVYHKAGAPEEKYQDALKIIRQEDCLRSIDEFGINRVLNNYFPGKLDFDFRRGDTLRANVSWMLNGYYWTHKEIAHSDYTEHYWKKNSYCYLDTYPYLIVEWRWDDTRGDVKWVWIDPNSGYEIPTPAVKPAMLSLIEALKRNVGDDYDSTYRVEDIPYNQRIWLT